MVIDMCSIKREVPKTIQMSPLVSNINNNKVQKSPNKVSRELDLVDYESIHGRFGWSTINSIPLSYVNRKGDEKFCAFRMVEMAIIDKFACLNCEILRYGQMKQTKMTKAEAVLFNEINFKHCDCFYGPKIFTVHDTIVKLSDVQELYYYLQFCYNKLNFGSKSTDISRCGFMKIGDDKSFVPYIKNSNKASMPLFYLDGESQFLDSKKQKVTDWDLAYIKFCCKLQGIRKHYYEKSFCDVVPISEVARFFPPETHFEICWPISQKHSQQFLVNKTVTDPITDAKPESEKRVVLETSIPPKITVLNQLCLPQTPASYLLQRYQNMESPLATFYKNMNSNAQTIGDPMYKLMDILIAGKQFSCINQNPNVLSSLRLINIEEFRFKFFPEAAPKRLYEALKFVHVEIYQPNPEQLQILKLNKKCDMFCGNVYLILVSDVLPKLSQIRELLQRCNVQNTI